MHKNLKCVFLEEHSKPDINTKKSCDPNWHYSCPESLISVFMSLKRDKFIIFTAQHIEKKKKEHYEFTKAINFVHHLIGKPKIRGKRSYLEGVGSLSFSEVRVSVELAKYQ